VQAANVAVVASELWRGGPVKWTLLLDCSCWDGMETAKMLALVLGVKIHTPYFFWVVRNDKGAEHVRHLMVQ
jgi:hypothetical protein